MFTNRGGNLSGLGSNNSGRINLVQERKKGEGGGGRVIFVSGHFGFQVGFGS